MQDPAVGRLAQRYSEYMKDGDTLQAAKIGKQLLAKRFTEVLRPGQALPLTQVQRPESKLPEGFAATATWHPGAKSLRAILQVKNPYYTLDSLANTSRMFWASFVVCASGADEDATNFRVTRNEDGKAQVTSYKDGRSLDVGIGKWKSFNGGYVVDVELPYSLINCFDKSWTRMGISASAGTVGPDCLYDCVSPSGPAGVNTYTWRLLTRD